MHILQYAVWTVKCTHIISGTIMIWEEFMRVTEISRTYWALK